jgi:2-oxoglutarate dehydrogenase E2 component (dihydrolipoamide succinyltransferase)
LKDDLVLVGQTIAIIETEGGEMVAVVKAAASQEAVAEVTKQLTAKDSVATQLISRILINFFSFSENIASTEGYLLLNWNKSMVQERW